MTTTLNGWDLIADPSGFSDRRMQTKAIPGCRSRTLTLRKEVLPLFLALAADYNAQFRPLGRGAWDEWSYNAPRLGRDSNGWSDHSSGTAIDLNAAQEGRAGLGNYKWWQVSSRQAYARSLLDKYQVVYWGGPVEFGGAYITDSSGYTPDWMHWGIISGTTISDVQAVIEYLHIDSRGYQNGRVAGL